jgi:hypothetical protein
VVPNGRGGNTRITVVNNNNNNNTNTATAVATNRRGLLPMPVLPLPLLPLPALPLPLPIPTSIADPVDATPLSPTTPVDAIPVSPPLTVDPATVPVAPVAPVAPTAPVDQPVTPFAPPVLTAQQLIDSGVLTAAATDAARTAVRGDLLSADQRLALQSDVDANQ